MLHISKNIFIVLSLFFIVVIGGRYGYNYLFESNSNDEVEEQQNSVALSNAYVGDLIGERGIVGASFELQRRSINNPKDASLLYQLGLVNFMSAWKMYTETGRIPNNNSTQEGLKYFKKALDLEPENLDYRAVYATALEETGEDKLAITQFRLLYKNDFFRKIAKHEGLIINYAEALERQGQREEALQELEKSLAIYPDNPYIVSAYNKIKAKKQK